MLVKDIIKEKDCELCRNFAQCGKCIASYIRGKRECPLLKDNTMKCKINEVKNCEECIEIYNSDK